MCVLMDGVENNLANSHKVANNHPEIIANVYLNCVAGLESCPVKLRTDCGTENSVMAAVQCTYQQDANVRKYG